MLKVVRIGLGVAAIAVASGCSLLFPADEPQCEVDADCSGRGFTGATCVDNLCVAGGGGDGGSGPWDCIGNVTWDAPDPSQPLTIHAKLAHLLNEDPVPDAPAKTCGPLDTDCNAPIDEATSDADGKLAIAAFYGFRGYTLVSPPASFPNMAPAIMWSNPPMFEENVDPQTAHLTAVSDMTGISIILGATINPELGHMFGLTFDCNGNLSADVALSADTVSPDTVPYYINGSAPSATAGATDFNGQAGFVNLPAGLVTISATSLDAGKYGSVTVLVKPGHVTYVALAPSP